MSVEALVWALNLAPVPWDETGKSRKQNSACAFVLVGLANHADPDGRDAFPGVPTLTRYTRLSERTVRTALDRLEAEGTVHPCDPDVLAAKIKRGDRRPNGYDLAMDRIRDDLTEDELHAIARSNPFLRPLIEEHLARGATAAPRENGRGATDAERGATAAERGAAVAPEPSFNPPSNHPEETSRREKASDLPRPDVERLCVLLADLVEGNGVKRPTITKDWRSACRRLLDIDKPKGGVEGVEMVMRWALADSFWMTNILSMPKFRQQYSHLVLKARADWEKRNGRQQGSPTDDRVQGWLDLRRPEPPQQPGLPEIEGGVG